MAENMTRSYGWQAEETDSTSYIASSILKILEQQQVHSILEIGCGNGSISRKLIRAGYSVVGMEPDEEGAKFSAESCPAMKVYPIGCYESPSLIEENDFDAIVSTEVIEYLFSPDSLLEFGKQKLSPNGIFILTTPYHGYWKNLALSLVNGWDNHFHALSEGSHIKFFSHRILKKLFEKHGFEVFLMSGTGRFPYLWKSAVVAARKK